MIIQHFRGHDLKICPYGYRKSADGRMEPDPDAAAVVQLIFELAASGTSAAEIARELFRRGIPTPGEYKAAHGNHTHDISRTHGIWCSSTVLRILEDERYIGSYVIGKRAVIEVGGSRSRMKDREKWHIIPDHHPAIIDKPLFEQVQATQRRFSQPHKVKHDYPLKGIVFCGCCGHALSRTSQKTARYICRHSQADKSLSCHNAAYNAAKLEQAVLLLMKKQLEATLPVNPNGTIQLKAVVEERSAYEQQMDELLDCKQSLFEQYLMGEITLESYQAQKAIYDERLLLIKSAYAAVVAQAKKKQEELERRSSRQNAAKLLEDADELTTAMVSLLIEKVRVFPNKKIEIEYKVQDIFE